MFRVRGLGDCGGEHETGVPFIRGIQRTGRNHWLHLLSLQQQLIALTEGQQKAAAKRPADPQKLLTSEHNNNMRIG